MRIRRRVHCVATWLSRIITVVGASPAAALVATWPLAHHLADAVPLGTERGRTVPLFDLRALCWTADRAIHGFVGYGDAPIFYYRGYRGAGSADNPRLRRSRASGVGAGDRAARLPGIGGRR